MDEKATPERENELIRAARELSALGYNVDAIKYGPSGSLLIKVFLPDPKRDTRKQIRRPL
jgi:hypothetical protein